jgi:hypothetical protein
MPKATTLLDVIVGEAGGRTPEQRYRDMLGIASVIHNRAAATGVSPQNVVANQREFNAYGKRLPSGTTGLRGLAKKAWDQVRSIGPVHAGTFYATPAATRNLPKGLQQIDATEKGHVYFTDPKNRAIGTALGYRPVKPVTQSPFDAVMSQNTPVPGVKPVQASVDPMQQLQRNREIGLLGMEATNSQPMRDMRFALETQKTGLLPRQELKPLDSPEPGLLASSISRNPFDTMQTVPQGVEKVARVDPSLVGFEQDVAKQSAWNRAGAALREQRGILQDAGPISGLLSQQVTPVGYDQRFAGPVRQVQSPVETAYQPTAEVTGPASMAGMVKDPVSTPGLMSNEERAMVDRQRGLLANQPLNSNTGARLLSGAKGLAGGFGGALLGGALLGPVGGLLGGLVGRQMTTGGLLNRFPDAPKGKTQGDGKETDYGRDVRQSSKQYDRAVSRGGIGLY